MASVFKAECVPRYTILYFLLVSAIAFIAADEPKKDDAELLKRDWSAVSIKGFRFAPPEGASNRQQIPRPSL